VPMTKLIRQVNSNQSFFQSASPLGNIRRCVRKVGSTGRIRVEADFFLDEPAFADRELYKVAG
jgi:hypothetical protein